MYLRIVGRKKVRNNKVSSEAYGEMVLEVNNTKATLLRLLNSKYEDESTLVYASVEFTRFCSNIGDHSDKVMSQCYNKDLHDRFLFILLGVLILES